MKMDDYESLITAARQVFAVIQERSGFSDLSAGDQARDKSVPESARLAALALKRFLADQISADIAYRELAAVAEVVRRAKGPIETVEGFALEFEKQKRTPHLYVPE